MPLGSEQREEILAGKRETEKKRYYYQSCQQREETLARMRQSNH
jgi:hypothetical protein